MSDFDNNLVQVLEYLESIPNNKKEGTGAYWIWETKVDYTQQRTTTTFVDTKVTYLYVNQPRIEINSLPSQNYYTTFDLNYGKFNFENGCLIIENAGKNGPYSVKIYKP